MMKRRTEEEEEAISIFMNWHQCGEAEAIQRISEGETTPDLTFVHEAVLEWMTKLTSRWLTPTDIQAELDEARNRSDRDPEVVEAVAGLVSKGLITAFYKNGTLCRNSGRPHTPTRRLPPPYTRVIWPRRCSSTRRKGKPRDPIS